VRPAERRALLITGVAASLACGVIALAESGGGDDPVTAAGSGALVADARAADPAPGVGAGAAPTTLAPAAEADLVGDEGEEAAGEGCVMTVTSLRLGESGESVVCLQEALIAAGFLTGPATGRFDAATDAAVRELQADRELYIDGVVGRESAISLGVWPDEDALVVRTPPPPPGAVDLMGYPLSSVSVSGPDAPPLPAGSGSGKRVVYERAGQRVWAVDANERVVRSWLVAGSKYANELPGTHEVYSRSDVSTAWNGKAWLPKMIRWLDTERGAIGFHAIPLHVEDNSPYQTEAELGQRLSGGCQRQANADAAFLWDFAPVGTKVVVV